MPVQVENIRTLTGHQASVFALGPAPESAAVLSGCGNGLVVSWPLDGEPGQPGRALARIPNNIFSLCLIPGGRYLLAGGLHGGVHVLDLAGSGDRQHGPQPENSAPAGLELRNLGDNKTPVFKILYRPQSHHVWIARGDGAISVWDSRDWSPVWQRRISTERLRDLSPEPGGQRMAVSASDGCLYLLDENTGELVQQLKGHEQSVFCAAWSPDGQRLVTGSRDARLRIWRGGDDLRIEQEIPAHLFTINDLLFDPEGRWLVTASRDKTIKIWSADDFRLLKVIERPRFAAHSRSVNALYWNAHTGYLVSASDDRSLIVWHLSGNQVNR